MEDLKTTVVIDNGSGHVKAGLADGEAPSAVFPAVVGRAKHDVMMPGAQDRETACFIGEAALARKGVLSLSYPVTHGIVKDWNDMEKVWHHTFFDVLRVNPEEHPVIITEAPLNPKKNRERMLELLFEKFSVPASFVVIQAVMSLYSYGRTTGCVVDSGDGVTHVVPVYEGFALPHAIQRLDLAGRDLSEYMVKILTEGGCTMVSSSEKEIVRDMKERVCYVCQDGFEEELKQAEQRPTDFEEIYTLPDGNTVSLRSERFRVPEVLFNPMMSGRELPGIHEATHKCIKFCDLDLRRELYKNILLSGGSTMFRGIDTRLTKELRDLAPQKVDVKVSAMPSRRYMVWIGAAIVSQLTNFQKLLIWKKDYDEIGPSIVHTRCA